MKSTSVILILVVSFHLTLAAKLPKDIEKCQVADTTCIQKVANIVISKFAKGHTGINLSPLDPLHISEIKLKQGNKSPVNIELNFRNVDLIGLAQHKFYKISGFQQDPIGTYELRLKGPVLYLIGPYTISGRVLILPIQGNGRSNMTLENPDLLIKFTGKTEIRNGKEYMYTDDLKLTFDITRLQIHLENLYNGDKLLGDSTNSFLNENWQEIYGELKQLIFDAFTLIIQNTLNNIFKKVPYKELMMASSTVE